MKSSNSFESGEVPASLEINSRSLESFSSQLPAKVSAAKVLASGGFNHEGSGEDSEISLISSGKLRIASRARYSACCHSTPSE